MPEIPEGEYHDSNVNYNTVLARNMKFKHELHLEAIAMAWTALETIEDGLDDFTDGMRDLFANLYYRHALILLENTEPHSVLKLFPITMKSGKYLETHIEVLSRTTAHMSEMPDLLYDFRSLSIEDPYAYKLACDALIDGIKYGVNDYMSKSPLRRSIEKRIKREVIFFIDDLFSIMQIEQKSLDDPNSKISSC